MDMVRCSMASWMAARSVLTHLGNGYGLLFHGFVDGDSVIFPHLVELVDADDAAVGQHHGAAFHDEVSRRRISIDRRRQTGGAAAFARSVDGDRRHALDEFEQLRFGGT